MDTPNGLQQDVDLKAHSTMRLGGTAQFLVTVTNRQEVVDAVNWARQQNLPLIMIGGGSNIIWRDEGFPGLVIVNAIEKYEDFAEDETNHYITIGAGENWDEVVARTIETGLTGIECLSLIPGSAGGTPVQNVGAYGQEIADTLVSVEIYDTETNAFLNMPAQDCQFGYRTSRFKVADKGRFLITALTLHLFAANPEPPFYAGLQSYLSAQNIREMTPKTIRDAVIAIRSAKLPDPKLVANNGSFFANPVVDEGTYAQLSADHDVIPNWPSGEGQLKLSAAWLIEQAGFKDIHDTETGMTTWPTQPLVLVNEQATSTAQLLAFKQKIVDAVQTKFGVTLEQEPELLP